MISLLEQSLNNKLNNNKASVSFVSFDDVMVMMIL